MKFEYKVISAPKKGLRAKGAKSAEDKFANALMDVMNTLGADGWEYQRTDTLPVEARTGLTSKATQFQNMMVFRRELMDDDDTSREAEAGTAPALIKDTSAEATEAIETYVENHAPSLPSPTNAQGNIPATPLMADPKAQI